MGKTAKNKLDLNDIDIDLCHITHLIDEAINLSVDVSHVALDDSEKLALNRSTAFCIVARDMLERLSAVIWDVVTEPARAHQDQQLTPAQASIAVTLPIGTLIERHQYAWRMFNDTCDRADTNSENFDEAYVDINKAFDEKEEQALKDIAACRTSSPSEEKAKAEYLLSTTGHTFDQDSFVLRTMLAAIVGENAADQA